VAEAENMNIALTCYGTTITVEGIPVGLYHYTLIVNGERSDAKIMVAN
jgi:hypothetical protein